MKKKAIQCYTLLIMLSLCLLTLLSFVIVDAIMINTQPEFVIGIAVKRGIDDDIIALAEEECPLFVCDSDGNCVARSYQITSDAVTDREMFVIKNSSILVLPDKTGITEKDIRNIRVGKNQDGKPIVTFKFSRKASKKLLTLTSQYANKERYLVKVFRGYAFSVSEINAGISYIEFDGSPGEALANVINDGKRIFSYRHYVNLLLKLGIIGIFSALAVIVVRKSTGSLKFSF